jgi:hypothetical protein
MTSKTARPWPNIDCIYNTPRNMGSIYTITSFQISNDPYSAAVVIMDLKQIIALQTADSSSVIKIRTSTVRRYIRCTGNSIIWTWSKGMWWVCSLLNDASSVTQDYSLQHGLMRWQVLLRKKTLPVCKIAKRMPRRNLQERNFLRWYGYNLLQQYVCKSQ